MRNLGEKQYPTKNIDANHLRPVKCEGSLTALGTLLVKGKTSHVWRFDMIDDAQRLISQVTVTLAIVDFDR